MEHADDIAPLLMRFVHVADASSYLTNFRAAERLSGQRWGWLVHEDALAWDYGPVDEFGPEFMGIKESPREAVDAAIAYIFACRPDLEKAARKEAALGRRYREERAAGRHGNAVS